MRTTIKTIASASEASAAVDRLYKGMPYALEVTRSSQAAIPAKDHAQGKGGEFSVMCKPSDCYINIHSDGRVEVTFAGPFTGQIVIARNKP